MLSISQSATNRGGGGAYSNPGTSIRGPAAAAGATSFTELEKTYFNLGIKPTGEKSRKAYRGRGKKNQNMHSRT